MVNIPKIVLKSQTRLSLNERFTQFGEQQEARLQMLKNDLHTRIVEESFQNGSHGSAELSKKLDRLARDIDNPERYQSFLAKKHRAKDGHRPHDNFEVHEEPIVPAYRPLLHRAGRRNNRVRKQPRSSKRLVTYGDVLSCFNDVLEKMSSTSRERDNEGDGEVSHWRAEALRGVKITDVSSRNPQKYSNPLMRDSDDETPESTSGGGGGGGGAASSGVSVHSRLGLKQPARPKNQTHKNRAGSANYRRGAFGNRATNYSGGASASRQVVTKEDLDRELDEYRQKGTVMDIEMGED